jgi:hypothetical protein
MGLFMDKRRFLVGVHFVLPRTPHLAEFEAVMIFDGVHVVTARGATGRVVVMGTLQRGNDDGPSKMMAQVVENREYRHPAWRGQE